MTTSALRSSATSILPGQGAVLIRVSTDAQDVARQRDRIVNWLRLRGYPVPKNVDDSNFLNLMRELKLEVFEDTGRRDQYSYRSGFLRLRDAAERGEIQWVIVEQKDRLGYSDDVELSHFVYTFRRAKCQLWVADANECFSEKSIKNSLMNVIDGQASEKFQKTNSKNVISKVEESAKLGKYLGGKAVPYGLDIVCKKNNEVLWRYVQSSKNSGQKIFPSGTIENVTGGVPSHKKKDGEEVWYDRSIVKERIDVVNLIYEWYTTENIGLNSIAKRLNEMQIDPAYNSHWEGTRVGDILDKPIYIGRPSAFRYTQSRFHSRHVDVNSGSSTIEEKEKNYGEKAKWVRNPRTNWVMPEKPIFEPIVPVEVFQAAMEKAEKKSKPITNKSENLWLMGLVVCDKCGNTMCSGKRPAKEKGGIRPPAYRCRIAALCDPARNIAGCKAHSVTHETVEKYVNEFLDQHGIALNFFMNLNSENQLRVFGEKVSEKRGEYVAVYNRIMNYLRQVLGSETENFIEEFLGKQKFFKSGEKTYSAISPEDIQRVYQHVFENQAKELRVQLSEKEEEHSKLVDAFSALTSKLAIAKANEKLAALEAELDALKARLDPLDKDLISIKDEMGKLAERFAEARVACQVGTSRRKAEAIRRVIREIRLSFTTGQYHSKLCKVTIVPVIGDSTDYQVAGMACRSSSLKLLQGCLTWEAIVLPMQGV
jgi:hypothetical protein